MVVGRTQLALFDSHIPPARSIATHTSVVVGEVRFMGGTVALVVGLVDDKSFGAAQTNTSRFVPGP